MQQEYQGQPGADFFLGNPLPPGAYDPLDNAAIPVGGGDAIPASDDESDEDEPLYRAIPDPELQRIIDELGNPGPRCNCFGCRYVGEGRQAMMADERLGDVYRTMANGIGQSDPIPLAKETAVCYAKARRVVNATQQEGRRPLPTWSAASILDHWMEHTQDPQIRLWIFMWITTSTIHGIRRKSLWKRNRKTGEERVDKDQFSIMRDCMRIWLTVSSKDPRKFAYYREDSMISNKSMANGGLSTVGKPVYNFFSKKRGRGEYE